jgi:5-methylcytosine-specific restriction endonuclease McrA
VTAPAWNDNNHDAGGMVKVALWLVQQVGVGNTFTKEELRRAFPGVSQIDRRLRDLRSFDWVIHSNTQDIRLAPQDQRFVRQGVPVWDPEARREAERQKPPSAKERAAVLARDGYMCTLCGISGGEPYLDDLNQSAVLSVRRREVSSPNGGRSTSLVTECKRCTSGGGGSPAGLADTLQAIRGLDPSERRRLNRWIERGRRGPTPLERAWNLYRSLPIEVQASVWAELGNSGGT